MIFGKKSNTHPGSRNLGIVFIFLTILFIKPAVSSAEYKFLFHDPGWGFSDSVEAIERLTPFCDFLGQYLDQPIRPIFLKRETALESYLAEPGVIMGFINANIVADKKDSPVMEPFLTAVRNGRATHKKVLLAPNRDTFSDINALKGQRLAILSTDASTLSTQLSSMCSVEIDSPSDFFSEITQASSAHSAVFALVYELSDAAFTTLDSFERVLLDSPSIGEHIKTLCTSESNPNGLFVQIGNRVSIEKRDILETALLSLPNSENGQSLLADLSMSGFESLKSDQNIASYIPPQKSEQPSAEIQASEELAEDMQTDENQPEDEPAPLETGMDADQLIASKNTVKSEQTSQGTPQIQQVLPETSEPVKRETETFYYRVRKGDTLWSIAEKYLGSGLAYTTLVRLNGLKNPNRIALGQKLIITKPNTDG